MTRKDYILIANALRDARPLEYPEVYRKLDPLSRQWEACVRNVARALHRDSAEFDDDRFLKACGVLS